MGKSKLVYIASPYAIGQGATPVAPHLLYPQILADGIPEEREAGLRMGLRVLEACDEIWLCGGRITLGMRVELATAESFELPVRRIRKI